MKIRLEILLEHPIMFLSDPYEEDEVPIHIEDKAVAYTNNCIAFRVNSHLEGGANVVISSSNPPIGTIADFSREIRCANGTIAVSDSHRFNYCLIPIKGQSAYIELWRLSSFEGEIWIKLSIVDEY